VDAFRDALNGNGSVFAADITLWAAAMHAADRAFKVPRSDAPHFVDALVSICSDHDVGLLVPSRDEELPVLSAAVSRFEAIGTRVHVPPLEALEACLDKKVFHEVCVDRGFPVAELVAEPVASDLPLFVRPRRGKGSIGAGRIDRPNQLEELSGQWDQLIFNRYVDAPEFTIDVFINHDGRQISAVPRERVQVVAGESYMGRTIDDSALSETAAELCLALGLKGHNTVQAFRWDGGLSFIEVNPRFGGGAALGFAAGAPSPVWLVQEIRGEPLNPRPGRYRSGLVMLRYTRDLFVDEAGLRA
jgi:carbamoyl-phosphate synthase large subunit